MSISIEDHGSIMLFQPLDAEAQAWLQENTDGQWCGRAKRGKPWILKQP